MKSFSERLEVFLVEVQVEDSLRNRFDELKTRTLLSPR